MVYYMTGWRKFCIFLIIMVLVVKISCIVSFSIIIYSSPSRCCVMYNDHDFLLNGYFLKDIQDEKYKRYKSELMTKMKEYLEFRQCRRVYVVLCSY